VFIFTSILFGGDCRFYCENCTCLA
jgi:hypothetical protein